MDLATRRTKLPYIITNTRYLFSCMLSSSSWKSNCQHNWTWCILLTTWSIKQAVQSPVCWVTLTLRSGVASWKTARLLVRKQPCLQFRKEGGCGNGSKPFLWTHSKYCFTAMSITMCCSRGCSDEIVALFFADRSCVIYKRCVNVFYRSCLCLESIFIPVCLHLKKNKHSLFDLEVIYVAEVSLKAFFLRIRGKIDLFFCLASQWVEISPIGVRWAAAAADNDDDFIDLAGVAGISKHST